MIVPVNTVENTLTLLWRFLVLFLSSDTWTTPATFSFCVLSETIQFAARDFLILLSRKFVINIRELVSIRGFSNSTGLSSASLYLDYWSWWCILNNLNCSIKNSLQTFRSPKYRNDKNWTAQTSQLGDSQENNTKQIRLSFQKEAQDKISSKQVGAMKVLNSPVGNRVGGGSVRQSFCWTIVTN